MSQLWKKALQAAEDARLLFRRGGHMGAVSLAYSAAFTAARALLVERAGYEEAEVRRHAAVLRLLSDHFVSTKLVGPEIARGFQSLSLARASADYSPEIVSEEDARQALEFMERFLSSASKLREQERKP